MTPYPLLFYHSGAARRVALPITLAGCASNGLAASALSYTSVVMFPSAFYVHFICFPVVVFGGHVYTSEKVM